MGNILKKILYIVLAGGIFFVLSKYLSPHPDSVKFYFTYAHPLMLFIAIVVDPLVGGLGFALGVFFLLIGTEPIDWIAIVCAFLNAASVGYFMPTEDLHNGFFFRKSIMIFNTIQTGSNFLCWGLIYPLLTWLIYHEPFLELVDVGLRYALSFSLSCLVFCTLHLEMYARSRFSAANFYRS